MSPSRSLFSTLLLSATLLSFAAPASSAGRGGIGAGYRQRSASHSLGVQVHIGSRAPRIRSATRSTTRRAPCCSTPHPGSCTQGHAGYRRGARTRRVWVPGRYELVQKRVWIPGAMRQVWMPARYETHYDHCGQPYSVLISPGRYECITDPGHWEYRDERGWRDPHWEVRPT